MNKILNRDHRNDYIFPIAWEKQFRTNFFWKVKLYNFVILIKKTSRYSNNSLTNVSLDYSFMLNLPSCLTIRFFVHWQTISIANEWQAERERERTHQNVRSICFEIIVKQIRNQSLKTIRKRYLDICQIKKKKK